MATDVDGDRTGLHDTLTDDASVYTIKTSYVLKCFGEANANLIFE